MKKAKVLFPILLTVLLGGCSSSQEKPAEMGRYVEKDITFSQEEGMSPTISSGALSDLSYPEYLEDDMIGNFHIYDYKEGAFEETKQISYMGAIPGYDGTKPPVGTSLGSDGSVFFARNNYVETEREENTIYHAWTDLYLYDPNVDAIHMLDANIPDLDETGFVVIPSEKIMRQAVMDYYISMGLLGENSTPEDFDAMYNMFYPDTPIEDVYSMVNSFTNSSTSVRHSFMMKKWIFLQLSNDKLIQLDRVTNEVVRSYQYGSLDSSLMTGLGENLCFTAVSGQDTFYILNPETGELVQKTDAEVLTNYFADKNYGGIAGSSDGSTLYVICNDGIYRYVLGQKEPELLLDGSRCSLCTGVGTPVSFLALPDEEFYFVTSKDLKTAGYRYLYDPAVPANAEHELKVYSLNRISRFESLIAVFQAKNPDIHINYTYAKDPWDFESSVTDADALKILNTKLLAKEGPDLMFLDDVPISTYVHNGMLENIQDIVDSVSEEEYFKNIINGITLDGDTYAIPLGFQIPAMIGYKKEIGEMDNLEELQAVVQKIVEDPDDDAMLCDITDSTRMLATLYVGSAARLFKADGTLDQKNLETFLATSQNLFQMSLQTMNQNMQNQEAEWDELMSVLNIEEDEEEVAQTPEIDKASDYINPVLGYCTDVFFKQTHFSIGTLAPDFTYSMCALATAMEADADFMLRSLPGNDGKCFIGSNYAGINSLGTEKEAAKRFLEFLISQDGQEILWSNKYDNSFSVIRALCLQRFRDRDQDILDSFEESGNEKVMKTVNRDGKELKIELVTPSDTFYDNLESFIDTLEVPMYHNNKVYREIVQKGYGCIQNNLPVGEAAESIVNQMDLYLSE